MSRLTGYNRRTVAESYILSWSNGPEPRFLSHETARILDTSEEEALVRKTVRLPDKEPAPPLENHPAPTHGAPAAQRRAFGRLGVQREVRAGFLLRLPRANRVHRLYQRVTG